MHAVVGDQISIPGQHVGEAWRKGEVVAVRGEGGLPPYLVRWSDGHEAICYPGPETRLTHAAD